MIRSMIGMLAAVSAVFSALAAVDVTDMDCAIKAPAWKAGLYEWPSAYPKCVREDWSGVFRHAHTQARGKSPAAGNAWRDRMADLIEKYSIL